jgi:hypothetical protein
MFLLAIVLALVLGRTAPLSEALFIASPVIPNALQEGVMVSMPKWVWDPVLREILRWPAWIAPLAVGALTMLITLGRPRRGV